MTRREKAEVIGKSTKPRRALPRVVLWLSALALASPAAYAG